MTWFGAKLSQDQEDLVGLVGALVGKLGDDADGPDAATARAALIEAGLWTLGVAEEHGGGGASLALRLASLCALGQHWAAVAWACAQAHAAAEIIGDNHVSDLLTRIHAGGAVAVIDAASSAVELDVTGDRIHGTLWRLDPAASNPHVVVLADAETAWLLPPETLRGIRPLTHTGMAGAHTMTAVVEADAGQAVVLHGVPVEDVLARLRLAGAAIAAGIALEAADRSLAYAQSRIQFGAPLTELPTVRVSLLDQAALAADALAVVLNPDLSPVRAAAVLAGNCERAITTATAAVQSHGGYGYLSEYGVERLLRDAVSLRASTDADGGVRWAAAVHGGHADVLLKER